VVTKFYNEKTKGPTLIELFTATGNLKKFYLTTWDVRCVHHVWHSTHPYGIQVIATHVSTWVHRYSSLLQWSVALGQRGDMVMFGEFPVFDITPKKRKYSRFWTSGDFGSQNTSCWSFPDACPIQRPGNTVFRYWRTSHWKWVGLPSCWNMNVGIFCNMSRYVIPGVHYETPCTQGVS
jgi:hypothetical protein